MHKLKFILKLLKFKIVAYCAFVSNFFVISCKADIHQYIFKDNAGGAKIESIIYLDSDFNGKLDHAKVVFNRLMLDTTFDGYDNNGTPSNQIHKPTMAWKIEGYTNLRLDTRNQINALPAGDIKDNDQVIFIMFDERLGDKSDTGNLPQLTMQSSNFRSANFGGCYIGTLPISCEDIYSVSVKEKDVPEMDGAPPVVVSVSGVEGDSRIAIYFSEPVSTTKFNCTDLFTPKSFIWQNLSNTGASEITKQVDGDACKDGRLLFETNAKITKGDFLRDKIKVPIVYDKNGNSSRVEEVFLEQAIAPFIQKVWTPSSSQVGILFSEDMDFLDSAILNKGSYQIANLPINSVTQINAREIRLNTISHSARNYELVILDDAKTSIKDLNNATQLSKPYKLKFKGNPMLEVTHASAWSLLEVDIFFNKPIKSSTQTLSSNYQIYGPENPNILSVTRIDSIRSRLLLDKKMTGAFYTIVVANATNNDGFDNDSASIHDESGNPLSGNDRASFHGIGLDIKFIKDGPLTRAPFGDNSLNTSLVSYQNRVLFGPNISGNRFLSLSANGKEPMQVSFRIEKDKISQGQFNDENSDIMQNSAEGNYFNNIGFSNCIPNSNKSGFGCGPDNEDGFGKLQVHTLKGKEYLFLSGSSSTGQHDYLYYTDDSASDLNFKYLDLNTLSRDLIRSVQSLAVIENRLYLGVASPNLNQDNSRSPDLLKLNFNTDGCILGLSCDLSDDQGITGERLKIYYKHEVGGKPAVQNYQVDRSHLIYVYHNHGSYVGIDSMIEHHGSLYLGNGGHHAKQHNGGLLRSIVKNPQPCSTDPQDNCSQNWELVTPTDSAWYNQDKFFSIELQKTSNFIPADLAIPFFVSWNNFLIFGRNLCITNAPSTAVFSQAIKEEDICTSVDSRERRPQLWICKNIPCSSVDWRLIDGRSELSQLHNNKNIAVSLLQKVDNYLYVGFDNPDDGATLYRTNALDPSISTDWVQVGSPGFGINATQIYSSASTHYYGKGILYFTAGDGKSPVSIFKETNP